MISFSRVLSLSLSVYAYIYVSIFLSFNRVLFLLLPLLPPSIRLILSPSFSPTASSLNAPLIVAKEVLLYIQRTFYFISFRCGSHHRHLILSSVRPFVDWPIRNCENLSLDEKIQLRPPTLSFFLLNLSPPPTLSLFISLPFVCISHVFYMLQSYRTSIVVISVAETFLDFVGSNCGVIT